MSIENARSEEEERNLLRDIDRMMSVLPKPKTWRSRLFGHEWIRVFIIGDRLVAFRLFPESAD